MAATDSDIVNEALQLIGNNAPLVTGNAPNFDNSANGQAASKLYVDCVNTVARSWGWDFARNTVTLVLSGNVAPAPWSFEYLYPGNGVEIWQLMPPALGDPNNPLPQNWAVGNALVGGIQTKVIRSNLAGALATFNNVPGPATWDAIFRQSVVRLLASELGTATAGRAETAGVMMQSGSAFESLGQTRAG